VYTSWDVRYSISASGYWPSSLINHSPSNPFRRYRGLQHLHMSICWQNWITLRKLPKRQLRPRSSSTPRRDYTIKYESTIKRRKARQSYPSCSGIRSQTTPQSLYVTFISIFCVFFAILRFLRFCCFSRVFSVYNALHFIFFFFSVLNNYHKSLIAYTMLASLPTVVLWVRIKS